MDHFFFKITYENTIIHTINVRMVIFSSSPPKNRLLPTLYAEIPPETTTIIPDIKEYFVKLFISTFFRKLKPVRKMARMVSSDDIPATAICVVPTVVKGIPLGSCGKNSSTIPEIPVKTSINMAARYFLLVSTLVSRNAPIPNINSETL